LNGPDLTKNKEFLIADQAKKGETGAHVRVWEKRGGPRLLDRRSREGGSISMNSLRLHSLGAVLTKEGNESDTVVEREQQVGGRSELIFQEKNQEGERGRPDRSCANSIIQRGVKTQDSIAGQPRDSLHIWFTGLSIGGFQGGNAIGI